MAAAAGAEILNDVTALRNDPQIAEVAPPPQTSPDPDAHARQARARCRKNHSRAMSCVTSQKACDEQSLVARRAGVPKSQIILDPGIGFGKSYEQNGELLARLPELARLGFPILVGTSRKSFLGAALKAESRTTASADRIWGTAATVAASILQGAHIVRVHDVAEMAQIARVTDAVLSPRLLRSGPKSVQLQASAKK